MQSTNIIRFFNLQNGYYALGIRSKAAQCNTELCDPWLYSNTINLPIYYSRVNTTSRKSEFIYISFIMVLLWTNKYTYVFNSRMPMIKIFKLYSVACYLDFLFYNLPKWLQSTWWKSGVESMSRSYNSHCECGNSSMGTQVRCVSCLA